MWIRHVDSPENIGAAILLFLVIAIVNIAYNLIKAAWLKWRRDKCDH